MLLIKRPQQFNVLHLFQVAKKEPGETLEKLEATPKLKQMKSAKQAGTKNRQNGTLLNKQLENNRKK